MTYIDEKIVEKIKIYCAYQERCHSEVRYKLVDLGARGEELEQIISVLIDENFLNEERYAKAIVRGKLNNNQWGRKKIIEYLKQKKVSDYCIKKGLLEIDEDKYEALMNAIIDKKFASLYKESNAWVKSQKVLRYLMQKGFESDIVIDLLKRKIE